jgi:hypothetical protein
VKVVARGWEYQPASPGRLREIFVGVAQNLLARAIHRFEIDQAADDFATLFVLQIAQRRQFFLLGENRRLERAVIESEKFFNCLIDTAVANCNRFEAVAVIQRRFDDGIFTGQRTQHAILFAAERERQFHLAAFALVGELRAKLQLVGSRRTAAVKRPRHRLQQRRFAGAVAAQQADDIFGKLDFSAAEAAEILQTE